MKNLLKHISLITIFVITLLSGVSSYVRINDVSSCEVWADDEWSNSTRSEIVQAFQSYCKSRNIIIDGSVAGTATAWTTDTFDNICKTLGIDVNSLSAEIKHKTDSNVGLKWLFTVTGVNAFNRIAAELLQNHSLAVGDTGVDKTVKSDKWFTDLDGNGCWCYVLNVNYTSERQDKHASLSNASTIFSKYGTPFIYSNSQLISHYPDNYTSPVHRITDNFSTSFALYYQTQDWQYGGNIYGLGFSAVSTSFTPIYRSRADRLRTGNAGICICPDYSVRLGVFYSDYTNTGFTSYKKLNDTDENIPTETVKIVTPSNKPIKPSLPEDEPIEMDPEGNTGDDGSGSGGGADEDDPSIDYDPYPDGGGTTGGGGDNPIGGTGSDGLFTLPDLDFNLPSINWSLGDLSEKFPFSIPFDIISLLTVLNAPPETPKIEGTIDLIVYEWDLNLDFSQFDNFAVIVRNVEFVGFIVALIALTIKLVKG